MTSSSEAWTAPFGADGDDTRAPVKADRLLLVVGDDGGIVRGFIDPVSADVYARTVKGVVARLGVVVQDYREVAA